MKLNMSLQNKIFLMFISVVIISVGIIGWYGYKSTSEAYMNSAFELSKQSTNALDTEIEDILKPIPGDLIYMSNIHALKEYMIWKSMGEYKKVAKWKNIFENSLLNFLEAKKDYFNARVIDVDGNELVVGKYDIKTDSVELVPANQLQNKKERDYVREAKKLKKGEFYISDMNLNVEYGKIQKPYVPVVRYSTPMIDENNELIGIFVVNLYADKILKIIQDRMKKQDYRGVSYYLIDKDGNYLYHEDKAKRWNAQLKNGANFNNEHFDIKEFATQNDSGVFIKNNKIYSFHIVHPMKDNLEKYWYIVSSIDSNVALAMLDEFKQIFLILLLVLIIVSFYSIRYYLSTITSPLSKVTQQLKALSQGIIKKEDIVYNAHDEVGDIVRSTSKVVDAIETTINQANAVANGDFSKEIQLLSKYDKLGLAITDMTKRLKEISILAEKLSTGNYDTRIIAKSGDDKLGLALIDMIKYLQAVTKVAESVARGEIDVEYKAVGKDDRLGIAMLKMISYLKTILNQANSISKGDFSHTIEVKSKNDELSIALAKMTEMLESNYIKNKNEIYFSDGIGEFSDTIAGITDNIELAKRAITTTSRYVGASSGVVYTLNKEKNELNLVASYAFSVRQNISNTFKVGEGVIGQVALEREPILLKNIKEDIYDIHTGTTVSKPKEVFTFPLMHEGELFGVIEVMSLDGFSEVQKEYLIKAGTVLATSLFSTTQNMQIKTLLEDSKRAYEELQVQSEELQESNIQMEEQQQQLTLQAKEMQVKNEELIKAKNDLDKRAEDLERASKYKSEFLANMSHELRTPLNSIILLSKLLSQNQNGTLSDGDISKSSVIYKAGNDLLLLINDILDLSKIESGNMELNESEVYTSEIVDEIQGLFSEVAKDKKITFEVNDNFKNSFITDKTKLLQIIKNLLSNAFKFTKEGKIEMSMKGENDKLFIEIKDSGIGIPKSKLALIFEAFKQVDGSISREYGGTGLGLSISKTFVDLMGGTIEVESNEGEGSTFRVVLPIKKDIKLQREGINNSVKNQSKEVSETIEKFLLAEESEAEILEEEFLNGKNILIVDDDSRNIFTLSSVLQELGAETYSALNGEEAFHILEDENSIDLILMDIMMPVMDGLKTIEKIRLDERFKNIPIIVITAKTMKEDKEACLRAGANDYLAKPIDHGALISMLKAWSN